MDRQRLRLGCGAGPCESIDEEQHPLERRAAFLWRRIRGKRRRRVDPCQALRSRSKICCTCLAHVAAPGGRAPPPIGPAVPKLHVLGGHAHRLERVDGVDHAEVRANLARAELENDAVVPAARERR
ncbi:MAG: hypothetical protein ACYCWW_18855 [Deltaproteobacteria bacterium]